MSAGGSGRPAEVVLGVGPASIEVAGAEVRGSGLSGSVPGPVLSAVEGAPLTVTARAGASRTTLFATDAARVGTYLYGYGAPLTALPSAGPPMAEPRTGAPPLDGPGHPAASGHAPAAPYGLLVVEPRDEAYWPPADSERHLVLHDEAPSGGPVPLTNGSADWRTTVAAGGVARLHLANASTCRVFRLRLPGTRLKLVGSALGRVEKEGAVEEVLLAPGDRAVVYALFEQAGEHRLEHRLPGRSIALATFEATGQRRPTTACAAFEELRRDAALHALRLRLPAELERAPDAIIATGASGTRHVLVPGSLPKLRLLDVPTSNRPRHRVVAVEGGRLLVLSRDGVPARGLAWVDTLLLRAGEVVDGLVEAFGSEAVSVGYRDIESDTPRGTTLLHVVPGPGPLGRRG